jgi:hypothetical protein
MYTVAIFIVCLANFDFSNITWPRLFLCFYWALPAFCFDSTTLTIITRDTILYLEHPCANQLSVNIKECLVLKAVVTGISDPQTTAVVWGQVYVTDPKQ